MIFFQLVDSSLRSAPLGMTAVCGEDGGNNGGGGLCEANSPSFGGGWGEATAVVSAFSIKAHAVIPTKGGI